MISAECARNETRTVCERAAEKEISEIEFEIMMAASKGELSIVKSKLPHLVRNYLLTIGYTIKPSRRGWLISWQK